MTSYIRILNAAPNTPAVDIYANNDLIFEGLDFKEISPYVPLAPTTYHIQVYPEGTTDEPLVDTEVYIPPNSVFNVAVIGSFPNIDLYPILEPSIAQESGNACLRFVHLSPDAAAFDIEFEGGPLIFEDVDFKGISNYVCMPADTYNLKVLATNNNDPALTISDLKLDPNTYYTIYTVGLRGESPNLELLLVTEPRES